jgi:2-phosphoglycolate phosphatase
MKDVQCVLFDLDGTLIDSVPAYFDLMAAMLDAVGLPQVPKALVAEFMTGGLSVLEKMVPADMTYKKDQLIQQLLAVGRPLSAEMFLHRVQMIPEVDQLLPLLASKGIPIGVVTSTARHVIDRKLLTLERRGLRALLGVIIATEDAPRKKPAPDPLLEGARQLGVPPEECLYVGDSHVDIRAGRAAGMRTAGVLTGLDDAETLQRENPTLLLNSVGELCPLFS